MKNNKGTINNFLWKFSERIVAQFISLFVSIILARLLDPEHYGVISMVNIFIALANVFVSDGLGSALIQKKDADSLDYSSVLYCSIGLSIVFYFIIFCTAPYIALFYNNAYDSLVPVLRVMGLSLILASINSVQQAYVAKRMIFQKFFLATIIGTITSAIVGIVMAYCGFGVWALVAQSLVNQTINTIVLGISLHKKPVFAFSFTRIKTLFHFGSRILATGLLIQGYQELRALLIGKIYTSADLAYYDKGRSFPNLIVVNINASISAVLFPKIANSQDDLESVKNKTRQAIRFGSYLMAPVMLGLLAVSDSFVRVVLTEKWLPCVPLMRWFCIVYLFQPIHTANAQAIKGMGRSDITLKLEIVKKVLELVSLIIVMNISVPAIVISMAVLTTLFTFVNAYPNIKFLRYSFKEQLSDLLPGLLMGGGMLIAVLFVGTITLPHLLKLVLQIITGAIVYVVLSIISQNKEFRFICDYIRDNLWLKKKSNDFTKY